MPISTKTRPRGKHLPPGSDDAAMSLRSAFQNDQLLEDFGPELTDLTSVIGHHDENQPADVAKLQSLLWAAGHTDLKDIEGPRGYIPSATSKSRSRSFNKNETLRSMRGSNPAARRSAPWVPPYAAGRTARRRQSLQASFQRMRG